MRSDVLNKTILRMLRKFYKLRFENSSKRYESFLETLNRLLLSDFPDEANKYDSCFNIFLGSVINNQKLLEGLRLSSSLSQRLEQRALEYDSLIHDAMSNYSHTKMEALIASPNFQILFMKFKEFFLADASQSLVNEFYRNAKRHKALERAVLKISYFI